MTRKLREARSCRAGALRGLSTPGLVGLPEDAPSAPCSPGPDIRESGTPRLHRARRAPTASRLARRSGQGAGVGGARSPPPCFGARPVDPAYSSPQESPVPRVVADRRPFGPLVHALAVEGRERLTRRDWTSALARAARGATPPRTSRRALVSAGADCSNQPTIEHRRRVEISCWRARNRRRRCRAAGGGRLRDCSVQFSSASRSRQRPPATRPTHSSDRGPLCTRSEPAANRAADHTGTLPVCCYDGTRQSRIDGKGDFLS
jgi:hypothetical protein